MASYNRYQYETSPRKLEPEYKQPKKRYPKKSAARNKKIDSTSKKQTVTNKQEKKLKAKVVIYIIIAFAIMFAISYRNSLIGEKFSQIKSMKSELSLLEKENEQLKANIESSLNLSSIEKNASDNLGMTKLDNARTIYINMPKQDYVQSGTEEVIKNETTSWLQNVIDWVASVLK